MIKDDIFWIKDYEEFIDYKGLKDNPDLDLVWDYSLDDLVIKEFCSGDGYTPERGEFNDSSWINLNIVRCENSYIKDTEGKLIYLDCSIFEFRHISKVFGKEFAYTGYLKRNTETLETDIFIWDEDLGLINFGVYDKNNVFDILVIDTLQESEVTMPEETDTDL